MNMGLSTLLDVGVPAILISLAVLLLMVHRELGPFAGLKEGGKWLLMGAFGMGVLAFGIKLTVATAVAKMPERTVGPLVAAYTRHEPAAAGVPALPGAPPRLPEHYVWQALPQTAPAPADNPTTPEKVALGKRLFFDPGLSANGTVSCSSCHDLTGSAGADGRRTALGIHGKTGSRNAPTVWNAAFQSVLFWDGRAASLEEQAKGPMLNPLEMGMPSAAVVEKRVAGNASYRGDFARAFGPGRPITLDRIAEAIAAYERTLITPDSPYDRFVRGDRRALDTAQLRGMALFESLGCVSCHKGPNFSDASLLGGQFPLRIFPSRATPFDARYDLTADGGAAGRAGRGVWRVPSLRNVALTGPYFHNGSVDKLSEAVRVMANAQLGVAMGASPGRTLYWSPEERVLSRTEPRAIGDREVEDIVAFLNGLSSDALAKRDKN